MLVQRCLAFYIYPWLFTIDSLAKSATKDVLQNLFNNLLTVLLDSVRFIYIDDDLYRI